jgi:carboxylesterase type B
LFDRVISESNPASIFYKNTSQAQAEGERIAEALNCTGPDRASCMRSKPWLDIASIQGKFRSKSSSYIDSAYGWGPILGGPIGMTAQPVDMAIANTLPGANIPVMLGVTHDEAEQWVYQPFPAAVSPIEFDALLLLIFRNDSLGVAELYPLPDPGNATSDNRQTMATIGTHYTFICSNRRIATALSANNKQQPKPVPGPFLYHYDHVYSNASVWGSNFSYCADRVCHGAELPILFGTVDQFYTVKQEELDLGRQMRAYWAAFARGDLDASGAIAPPAGMGVPAWPAFSSGSEGSWMRFETASKGGPLPSPGWTSKFCDFWDTAGYGNF